jgi:hypothetical protein
MMAFSGNLHIVLRALLRPALRFCLRHCVSFPDLIELAKAESVVLARELAASNRKRVTVSQLSVMTGLNRREVTRLSREPLPREARFSLPARVLGQWEQDQRFCTSAGKPRLLSLTGPGFSFYDLVSSVSKDVNAASVLRELERTHAVVRARDGIRLVKGHVALREHTEGAVELLAADMETLTRAVEENVYVKVEPSNLHLRTEYDNIFVADIAGIRQELLELGARLHEQLRSLLAKHDKDLQPQRADEAGMKVVIGTFSWTGKSK